VRFLCGIAGMILSVCAQTWLVGQEKAASSQPPAVSVPFVGCKSDGQIGPQEAPSGTTRSVPITQKTAQSLAYYEIGSGTAVLAPRGWCCFGTYGSGGESLSISPEPIDSAGIFSTKSSGFSGSAIEVSRRYGDTSGRFDVARIIARVFPAYKSTAYKFLEGFDSATNSLAFGPYPRDALTYNSNRVVEYKTPAQTEGLGTQSWLKMNGRPIEGVAMLVGQTPDLLLLSVRLPPGLNGLTAVIVHQVERDAERRDIK
jgi:hypothetical protein